MRNGTSQAVLVGDLFSGEGPHLHVADDFVRQRCTSCSRDVSADDAQLTEHGYLCAGCALVAIGV
jgi:hypothetical protein